MSAETLRRAAALMRERAEAASPSPWAGFQYPIDSEGEGGEVVVRDPDGFDAALMTSDQFDDCPHIASWHPDVALAVADLLDEAANGIEVMAPLDWDYPMGPMDCTGSLRPEFRGALTVARAYLGESA